MDDARAILALAGFDTDALDGWPALTQQTSTDFTAADIAQVLVRAHELGLLLLPSHTRVEVRTIIESDDPNDGEIVVIDADTEISVGHSLFPLYVEINDAVTEDELTAAGLQAAVITALAETITAARIMLDALILNAAAA